MNKLIIKEKISFMVLVNNLLLVYTYSITQNIIYGRQLKAPCLNKPFQVYLPRYSDLKECSENNKKFSCKEIMHHANNFIETSCDRDNPSEFNRNRNKTKKKKKKKKHNY